MSKEKVKLKEVCEIFVIRKGKKKKEKVRHVESERVFYVS